VCESELQIDVDDYLNAPNYIYLEEHYPASSYRELKTQFLTIPMA